MDYSKLEKYEMITCWEQFLFGKAGFANTELQAAVAQ